MHMLPPKVATLKKRTPTYLQYDGDTVESVSFSSDILVESYSDSETTDEEQPVELVVVIPKGQSLEGHEDFQKLRRGSLRSMVRKIIKSQKRVVKNTATVIMVFPQFIKMRRQQSKIKKIRRKLEDDLKANGHGSFRTKKGFVEIGSEELCLEQFELDGGTQK